MLCVFVLSMIFTACSNLRWGTNAGVDVNFNGNGPKIRPHVSMDLYSGGKIR